MVKKTEEKMWVFYTKLTNGEELKWGDKLCKHPKKTSEWRELNRYAEAAPGIVSWGCKIAKDGI